MHLAYSRVPQVDPLAAARLLIGAGADVDAGYLWSGLLPPFTVLTGCFGAGEQGPGRQPRHPQGEALARLLLDHGAVANDGQALYNRMFNPDDRHLELLFGYGLGTGDLGVWQDRSEDAPEPIEEMMSRQADWAVEHGRAARLDLLAQQGFRPAEGAALHEAAFLGDEALVRALLDSGADPDFVDEEHGTTPLARAEYFFQAEVADVLRPATRHTRSASPACVCVNACSNAR